MKENTTIRTGILGSGFAARFHLEALRRVYGMSVEVVGVHSPTEERRREFAERQGMKEMESPEEVIEAADVIHLCTPPASHESLAVQVLKADRSVVIEKPFTGYFGEASDPQESLQEAHESIRRIRAAEQRSRGRVFYAENWVYAPAVQKERQILEKTGGQIIWMHGEEGHSGSHSAYYGIRRYSGGGSLMGKGVHPLTAALYLKQVEGRTRGAGKVIRPVQVGAHTHAITRSAQYQDRGFLRTNYQDVEDFGHMHITFEDDTFADIFASELILGGVHNWIEVNANNHRSICNINPNTAMQTYNPKEAQFDDIYVVEKTETKQGWAFTSPDEDWFAGYQHEMQAFYENVAEDTAPESDSTLAGDTIAVVYAAYLSASRNGEAVSLEPT